MAVGVKSGNLLKVTQIKACTAIWLTYYFWSNKTYRQAVFKYANPVDDGEYKLKQFAKKPIADTDLVYGHKERGY